MADRGLKHAVTALGFSLGVSFGFSALLTGGALAEQSWQGYAPRCQTAELAQEGMQDPCEGQLAMFGIAGPTVLNRNQSLDVETTGSIKGDGRSGSENAPL